MDKKFSAEFSAPPSPYRGKPFWAWNGKLDEAELRRQIRIFNQMGLGGFFMHSRVGLATQYLGEEWFDCVRACADEAKKLNMEAWMYDEDRWPSGAAGGIVTRNSKYRMRSLVLERLDNPKKLKWNSDLLAAAVANIDGNVASNVQQLSKTSRLKQLQPGQTILAFRVKLADPSPWYNGQTYLDTLSHDAVQQYIRVTHEAYSKEIGKVFGRLVPGIFTDEPNYGMAGDTSLPWTDKLPLVFRKRYGYDILPHLAELFFDLQGEPSSQARYHYYDCITFLFVDAFARQIGEWCEKNGVQFTGHVLCEETLSSQTHVVGDAMRFYEHMQAPGIDMLTEHWRQYNTAKQCTSAARQFGRKWRLSETNGCTGWDWSFEAHKAIGDWQAACGINLRCPHLSFYTMLGEAKRDYPASIFYQSPWWPFYDAVEGYFARVHVAMMRGNEVRDLLVIHPIESMWLLRRHDWHNDPAVKALDQMFDDLATTLLTEHVDFDYGDEELLSRHAKLTKADGKPALRMGKAVYKAILVPPMKTMRSSTLSLLESFADAGGTVVFAGDPAPMVDAIPAAGPAELAAKCTRAAFGREMVDAVAPACRRLTITDGAGQNLREAHYLLREDGDAFYLFVINTSHVPPNCGSDPLVRDRKAAFDDVRIRGFAGCAGQPIELDPTTGALYAAEAEQADDGWEIKTSLPRIASRLFIVPKKKSEEDVPARPPKRRDARVDALVPERWAITLSEPNCLVLDRPRYKIGDGEWQPATEILRVDSAVRDALGIPHRGGAMVQPWARPKVRNPKHVPIVLAYEFAVEAVPTGNLQLGIERPETFQIYVNGQAVSADAVDGWWVDKSLQTIPIDPAMLKLGRNEIALTCDFDETHSGLEIMYLLGNFGTRIDDLNVAATPPVTSLTVGDWCTQGLAFYSGSVSYRLRVWPTLGPNQRQVIRLGEYRGVAVRVLINGIPAGIAAWEPNEIDVTDAIVKASPGEVELVIEVIGHRRNSHGPLHVNEKWPTWTGPGEFVTQGDRWFEGYQLVPVGLLAPPALVVKE